MSATETDVVAPEKEEVTSTDIQEEKVVPAPRLVMVEERQPVTAPEAIQITKAQAALEMTQQRLSEALGVVAEPVLKEAQEASIPMQFKHFDFDTAEMVYTKEVTETPEDE